MVNVAELLLLRSAFARVAENAGCQGSDGVTITIFKRKLEQNLKELSDDLMRKQLEK